MDKLCNVVSFTLDMDNDWLVFTNVDGTESENFTIKDVENLITELNEIHTELRLNYNRKMLVKGKKR